MAVNSGINAISFFWLLQILCFIHKPIIVIHTKVTEGSAFKAYINTLWIVSTCIKMTFYEIFSVWIAQG